MSSDIHSGHKFKFEILAFTKILLVMIQKQILEISVYLTNNEVNLSSTFAISPRLLIGSKQFRKNNALIYKILSNGQQF